VAKAKKAEPKQVEPKEVNKQPEPDPKRPMVIDPNDPSKWLDVDKPVIEN
jgi:hypothetical protein